MPTNEFIDFLLELLAPLGTVHVRRMFGGYGIYLEDLMFGLVANEELFLKVDEINQADYEARGLEPFTYTGRDKPVQMSYWRAPEEGLEDPEILCDWARESIAAALRARRK